MPSEKLLRRTLVEEKQKQPSPGREKRKGGSPLYPGTTNAHMKIAYFNPT